MTDSTQSGGADVSPGIPEWILRVAAAVGLGVSALLLYQYVFPSSELCGPGGGCDVVKDSVYARPLGIPMPAIGVAYFTFVLVLVAVRRPWARSALIVTSAGGALAAVGFLALQAFVLNAWCKFCVVTDTAALVVAVTAVAQRRPRARPPGAQGWLLLGAVTAAAYAAPFGLVALERRGHVEQIVTDELPPPVAREQRPGVATIVEFLDFECPYCRKLHDRLEPILAEYGAEVRVVRKMAPLAMHVHAEQAARAWCCADDVGKGEEMAGALMHAESLDVASCETIAQKLGMDLAAFRECLADERTIERVRSDKQEATSIGVRSLPTFYIGRERFNGLPDEGAIRASLARAVAEARRGGQFGMNVRTITVGVPLDAHRDLDSLEPRLGTFLDAIRADLADRDISVRTARLTLSPVRDSEDQRLNPAQVMGAVRSLAEAAERLNLRWFNVPFDLTRPVHNGAIETQCELALEVIRRFPRSFINLIAASGGAVHHEAAVRAARFIRSVANLEPSGYVNFRVGVACNTGANTPFFPFSFSSDDTVGFSIGLEMPRELITIVNGMPGASLDELRDAILASVVPQVRTIQDVAVRRASEHGVTFHGIDVSIAPYPEAGSSVAQLMELIGLDQFGGHGTLLVTAFLTDILREIIRRGEIKAVGFNGVMLSLLEDEFMGKRNNLNTYSIDSLILYSTVCGCGIDMVPLPGDTFEEEIAAMILDVAAASTALKKPLGVRVLPVPARQEHELTTFNMDFLFNTRIKKVRNLGFAAKRLGGAFRFLGTR